MDYPSFVECDSCRLKPGTPTLCSGCLQNRRSISELHRSLAAVDLNGSVQVLEDKLRQLLVAGVMVSTVGQRERIAALALQGLLVGASERLYDQHALAEEAVQAADALIAALK